MIHSQTLNDDPMQVDDAWFKPFTLLKKNVHDNYGFVYIVEELGMYK